MAYRSIAQIDKEFKKRLDEASDDEIPQINMEHLEAKSNFYQAQLSEQKRQQTIASLTTKYEAVKGFEDLLKGDDDEELEESARTLAERFGQRLAPAQQEPSAQQAMDQAAAARAAYGPSAVGGGQSGPPRDANPDTAFVNEYAAKFNAWKTSGGKAPNRHETERFERIRGGRRITEAMHGYGKLPAGVTPDWEQGDLSGIPARGKGLDPRV